MDASNPIIYGLETQVISRFLFNELNFLLKKISCKISNKMLFLNDKYES